MATKTTTKSKTDKTARGTSSVALLAVIGLGAYYFFKRPGDEGGSAFPGGPLIGPAPLVPPPGSTPEEIEANRLLGDSQVALTAAFRALEDAKAIRSLNEQTQREYQLALEEFLAIQKPLLLPQAPFVPTPQQLADPDFKLPPLPPPPPPSPQESDAARRAGEAELLAVQQRKQLEARWTKAINDGTAEMKRTEANANRAAAAFDVARGKVDALIRKLNSQANGIKVLNAALQQVPPLPFWQAVAGLKNTRRDNYIAQINNLKIQWEATKILIQKQKTAAGFVRSDALDAVGFAFDAIEVVLRMTSDLAIIKYVNALANRTDMLARATRTKLGELENRLHSLEYLVVGTLPGVTLPPAFADKPYVPPKVYSPTLPVPTPEARPTPAPAPTTPAPGRVPAPTTAIIVIPSFTQDFAAPPPPAPTAPRTFEPFRSLPVSEPKPAPTFDPYAAGFT
ncbi:hypothetical protein LCGC14_1111800 [marine sediment metagenome]|uniref:Uncharacterized protein n=1 Tax=marine sediment metagenome TaxID=412755 RepID=A0A0F9MBA0_9ZZZZ